MTTPTGSSPATGGMKEIYQLKHNLCETSPADVLPRSAGKHVSGSGECDFMLAVQSLPPAEQAGRGASIYFILVNNDNFF